MIATPADRDFELLVRPTGAAAGQAFKITSAENRESRFLSKPPDGYRAECGSEYNEPLNSESGES